MGCRSGLCSSSVPATSPLWTRLGIEANQGSVFSIVTTSNQSQLSIHLQGGGGGGAVLVRHIPIVVEGREGESGEHQLHSSSVLSNKQLLSVPPCHND